jgi:hypothetical protein
MPRSKAKKFMTIQSLARYLGWSYSRAYRLVRLGRIKSEDSARGAEMKDRRISLEEAINVKMKESRGEVI